LCNWYLQESAVAAKLESSAPAPNYDQVLKNQKEILDSIRTIKAKLGVTEESPKAAECPEEDEEARCRSYDRKFLPTKTNAAMQQTA
jgi:hypothetical protein